MRDYSDVVAGVKDELVTRGVSLTGPCGAFEITRRVAWELREYGFGLLAKPTGNNCNGYSVDCIVLRDGTYVDVLINAETENRPAWQVGTTKVDASRWVAPADPNGVGRGEPTPAPAPADPDDAIERLRRQAQLVTDALGTVADAVDRLERRIVNLQQTGVRLRW